jgi:HD-like signal output (HDOD) protein
MQHLLLLLSFVPKLSELEAENKKVKPSIHLEARELTVKKLPPAVSQGSCGDEGQMTIEDLLKESGNLSSAPQIACKLNRLLKNSSSLDEIVEVAQYDPGLTARILQICNTPAYRGNSQISSLKEAFRRLGNQQISRIIWQVSVSKQMSASLPAYRLGAGAIWRHSVATALAAEEIWKLSRFEEDISTAFTAGLLHDVGKVLIDRALSPNTDLFRDYVEKNEIVNHEAESTLLGFNHAQLGGHLMLKWGQAESLVAAVTFHHKPLDAENKRFATLIKMANSCAHHYGRILQKQTEAAYPEVKEDFLDVLQIKASDLGKAIKSMQARNAEVEVMMAIM